MKKMPFRNLEITRIGRLGRRYSACFYIGSKRYVGIATTKKAAIGRALSNVVKERVARGPGRSVRRNPMSRLEYRRKSKDVSPTDIRELDLYEQNDAELNRRKQSFYANMKRKLQKGTYTHRLSVKLWRYYADEVAKKYMKEFGNPGDTFDVPTRERLARHLAYDALRYLGRSRATHRTIRKNPIPAAAWAAMEAAPLVYSAGEAAYHAGRAGYKAYRKYRDSKGRFKGKR